MMKTVKLVLTSLAALSLSGCVSWFYTPGMGELKELCKQDGGDKVYQVVYADGYYDVNNGCDRTCVMQLIRSDFQYIEFQETEKQFYLSSVMKAPGIWQIYKGRQDDPLCKDHLKKEFIEFTHSKDQDLRDFFASNCLAVKKLEKPESRYWYKNFSSSRYLDDNEEVKLRTSLELIEDTSLSYTIAEGKYYSLLPYKKSALDYGLTFTCKDAGIEIRAAQFPQSVILPTMKSQGVLNDK